jgi:hypothetical protein
MPRLKSIFRLHENILPNYTFKTTFETTFEKVESKLLLKCAKLIIIKSGKKTILPIVHLHSL